MPPMVLAFALIALHGLDGQTIYVNPETIVSARAPTSDLIHPDVKCTLQMSDGKLINVADPCEDVLRQIGKSEP